MDAHERAVRQRLKDDFPHYASRCLKIRTKEGQVKPFRLNEAQRYAHERLERQLAETGKVRALVLKARQMGFSTYIGGRFYHKVTHAVGQRAFILTHEQEATDNLFEMTERYHEHCPSLVKPDTGASNAKELFFAGLDSGYSIGTAGTKGVGRSKTVQFFHGSEVAFWPHADTHFAGVLQAVPDAPGTEVVLESTANGIGGEFHERWQQAESGEGDFIPIFVPWFMMPEYTRPVPQGFNPTEEEREVMEHHGLSYEQMAWRRAKLAELKDPLLFKQEYPATAAEAFQTTGHDSFISAGIVMNARKTHCSPIGPLVFGVDPARFGDDRFALMRRQGRKAFEPESWGNIDTVSAANRLRERINAEEPARVFIDLGNTGAAIVDILESWGHGDRVRGVNFGGKPYTESLEAGPKNRRAEMWQGIKDWLAAEGGADLPDNDALHADLIGPGYKYDMQQRLLLESKEDMRKRGVRSPDLGDALALTFAEPVRDRRSQSFEAPDLGVV